MGMTLERACVLPLVLVAGRCRERDLDDLVGSPLLRVAVLEAEVSQKARVDAVLCLARERGLQVGVAQGDWRGHPTLHLIDLVLRLEWWPQTSSAMGRAQLQLVNPGNSHVLGQAVSRRNPMVHGGSLVSAK